MISVSRVMENMSTSYTTWPSTFGVGHYGKHSSPLPTGQELSPSLPPMLILQVKRSQECVATYAGKQILAGLLTFRRKVIGLVCRRGYFQECLIRSASASSHGDQHHSFRNRHR